MKVDSVVLLSGGMDSTTLLWWHRQHKGENVRALFINYGQRHVKEREYAEWNAERLGVPFVAVDLCALGAVLPGSSQTQQSIGVPEGHYTEENMKLTVVPNRNMILLSIAVGHAIAHGAANVSYAAHSGDHAIYPDCRPEFVDALQRAVDLCDWKTVKLARPFICMTKADIVLMGKGLGVDYIDTWSCYAGREQHCGRCGTCVERREAFYLAKVEDPTVYEADAPSVEEMVQNNWRPPERQFYGV